MKVITREEVDRQQCSGGMANRNAVESFNGVGSIYTMMMITRMIAHTLRKIQHTPALSTFASARTRVHRTWNLLHVRHLARRMNPVLVALVEDVCLWTVLAQSVPQFTRELEWHLGLLVAVRADAPLVTRASACDR